MFQPFHSSRISQKQNTVPYFQAEGLTLILLMSDKADPQ